MEVERAADLLPSWEELFRVAPITALVLLIFVGGYLLGHWARGEAVRILREWIDEMRRK